MPVYIGIDWSSSQHEVACLNHAGALLARQTLDHSAAGFLRLDALCQKLGAPRHECFVALETAHHLLIDFLWAHHYTQVYVVPPSVTRSSRGRYRSSGARDDRSDAFLLADLLRTDRARFYPWRPDSLLTRQIRAQVSLCHHLTRQAVRLTNRLHAVLSRYYPAARHVFSDLQTQIALHFLQDYPTPQAAAKLSWPAFQAWAQTHHYPHPTKLPSCFARLQAPQPAASADTVAIYAPETVQLAGLLLGTVQAKQTTLRTIRNLFGQHPDAPIFASLPGAGDLLAPALLAHLGDDRQRFPASACLQALAGTCPVTDRSGKYKRVKFRRACDREFRHIAHQWARASLRSSVWAAAYWAEVRPHRHSDSHAYRCLANRWLAILWKLWQTRQLYDEEYHLRQRALRSKPRR
jgi:transposase